MNQGSKTADYQKFKSETPLKIIEPRTGFSLITEIRDVWRHRELLYLLAWRDYKVRYRQTLIGIAWALFQPLLAMLVFVFIFGRFKDITNIGIPYPLFVYSGMVIWQFFSSAVSESSTSLVSSAQMVTKIYFPRLIIPLGKILVQFANLILSGILLLIAMLYFGYFPSFLGALMAIPIILLLAFTSASIGIILSAVNVRFRDVQYVLPYFIQLGLFLSPIIYSGASLGKLYWLINLNPVTGIINAFRSVLFAFPFPTTSFLFSCVITIILFFAGMFYFMKSEGAFSDVI